MKLMGQPMGLKNAHGDKTVVHVIRRESYNNERKKPSKTEEFVSETHQRHRVKVNSSLAAKLIEAADLPTKEMQTELDELRRNRRRQNPPKCLLNKEHGYWYNPIAGMSLLPNPKQLETAWIWTTKNKSIKP